MSEPAHAPHGAERTLRGREGAGRLSCCLSGRMSPSSVLIVCACTETPTAKCVFYTELGGQRFSTQVKDGKTWNSLFCGLQH